MSREIKFRAWDKRYKQMFRVESIQFNSMKVGGIEFVNSGEDLGALYDGINSGEYHRRPYEVELMQYAGIKDIDEVEMYEGDIVEKQLGKSIWRYVIKWNDYYCELEAETIWRNFYYNNEQGEYVYVDTFTDDGGCNLPSASKGKIIGNIYENPKLIVGRYKQDKQSNL